RSAQSRASDHAQPPAPKGTPVEARSRAPATMLSPPSPGGRLSKRAVARQRPCSALAELEPTAGAGLTVLLPLHDPGVAGEEAGLLQRGPELGVQQAQCAAEAVADGAGLAGEATADDVHRDVDLPHLLEDLQRLVEDHLRRLTPEVLVERTAVDDDGPASFLHPNPGRGLLAAAGGVVTVLGLDRHGAQASTWRGSGFCAAWGC